MISISFYIHIKYISYSAFFFGSAFLATDFLAAVFLTSAFAAALGAVLAAGGASFETVIKTTCFLANMADFQAFNAVYEKYFVSAPARSCVAVKDLPKGVLCEVEAIAYVAK